MLYRIRTSRIGGQGVFATQSIRSGTIIMTEAPLLFSSDDEFVRGYDALSVGSRLKFHTLFNCESPYYKRSESAAKEIWRTNRFYISARQDAVFWDICKINHSCSPNAIWGWSSETRRMVVTAEQDVKRGEEILIPYLQFKEWDDVDHRRRQLRDWNFVCQCERCAAEVGSRKEALC